MGNCFCSRRIASASASASISFSVRASLGRFHNSRALCSVAESGFFLWEKPLVEVGDEVVSRNRTNGRFEPQHVTALTPSHQDKLVEMRIEGERTPLRPSTSHPFWVKRGDSADGGWTNAGQMRVGDSVQSLQGDWRKVVAISPLQGQETQLDYRRSWRRSSAARSTVSTPKGCSASAKTRW